MVGKYKVITLCGSTRFKDAFMETQKRLTLEGNIVISVGLFGHSGDDEVWNEGTKEMLDDMHKRKIDLADEIFIINVGGYAFWLHYVLSPQKVNENKRKRLRRVLAQLSSFFMNIEKRLDKLSWS